MLGINRKSTVDVGDFPQQCLFPQTADDLICQAKIFTGKEFIADPHWRATAAVGLSAAEHKNYSKFLDELNHNGSGANIVAFVSYIGNSGVYIVYADKGKRWNRRLDVAGDHGDHVDRICHEISHPLVSVSSLDIDEAKRRFYTEQIAVTGANMLKVAVGSSYVCKRIFPRFRQKTNDWSADVEPYPNFSIYTPSPAALYFNSEQGRAAGKARYLTPSGVVRFDKVADDICELADHFTQHLIFMKIFGDAAKNLSSNKTYRAAVCGQLGISSNESGGASDRQNHVSLILRHWWQGIERVADRAGILAPANIYAGGSDVVESPAHAKNYHLRIAHALDCASKVGDSLTSGLASAVLETLQQGIPSVDLQSHVLKSFKATEFPISPSTAPSRAWAASAKFFY